MRRKRERAQSILEYVILFGILTAMVAVTLGFIKAGNGEYQNKLESYIKG